MSRVDDLAEPVPKLILEADRSLMAGDDDRVLFNGRLHYGRIAPTVPTGKVARLRPSLRFFKWGHVVAAIEIAAPCLHELASLLEGGCARIRLFGSVAHLMSKCRFGHFPWELRFVANPIAKDVPPAEIG